MNQATDEETAEILDALMGYVSVMPDPRRDQGKRHELSMMIVMALTAVLSGADDWADVVAFSESQKGWLSALCRMPHGVPCVSTFETVFSMLAPKAFSRMLIELSERLVQNKRKDRQIAIDGKRLRRSFDDACKQGGLHLLHAFGVQTGLLLGQEATDSKENEIVAMPRLLKMLDIRGITVTVDAMLTQTSIAEQVKEQGGEYIMALKDNHPSVRMHVEQRFEFAARMQYQTTRMGESFGYHSTGAKVDKDHGRLEVRKVDVLCAQGQWFHAQHPQWSSVQSVVRIESERTVGNQEPSHELRYAISSYPAERCELIAECLRNHWAVENNLHWSLDTAFDEDHSRLRRGHSAQNFASLRRLALSRLRLDKKTKGSIKTKRFKAALDPTYRLKLASF